MKNYGIRAFVSKLMKTAHRQKNKKMNERNQTQKKL